jgi:PAS domain S-box-containing protein
MSHVEQTLTITAASEPDEPAVQACKEEARASEPWDTPRRDGDHHFALLHQANLAFHGSVELPEVVHSILDFVAGAMPCPSISIWLRDVESGELVCYNAAGIESESFPGRSLGLKPDLLHQVTQDGHTIVVSSCRPLPALQLLPLAGTAFQIHSLLAAPLLPRATSTAPLHPDGIAASLLAGTAAIGVILLASDRPHAFSGECRSLLEAVAAPASAAIGNAQLYERARCEIAERIRTEQALRESESRYRTLIETSPDAILVTNLHGTITLCNSRALELYGYQDKSRLIGRSLLSLSALELRGLANDHFQRALRGEPTRSFELVQVKEDGATFDAEFMGSLIADNNGEAGGIVAFVHDITAKKRAERAIHRHNVELKILNTIATQISQTQDREQLLATALDRSLEALEVDTGWAVLFNDDPAEGDGGQRIVIERDGMNAKALSSCKSKLSEWLERQVRTTRTPVLGSTEEIVDGEEALEPRCQVVGVPLQVGDRLDGMIVVMGLDHNHPRPLRLQQVQLLSAISHQVSIALENARLSAREAEIEMLRKLNKMRSDLLASFSHDLRTPLGIITMTCSTLLREEVQVDKALRSEMLMDIETQSAQLLRLVEGILDLGQLESGRLQLKRRPLNLGDLLRRLGQSCQTLTERHRFTFELPNTPLWVSADSDRIEQVLHHLLDNAIKYAPDGGVIALRAERHQDHVAVSVTDEGVGLADDQLDLVFERFYRVRTEATQHISGAGLGLATCRGIVEAHGGSIWAENAPDAGTTFVFTLPLAPDA